MTGGDRVTVMLAEPMLRWMDGREGTIRDVMPDGALAVELAGATGLWFFRDIQLTVKT